MKEKIKLNYCVISAPPMLGGAEINGVNVVGETLCSKSFNRNRLKKFMHVGIDTCTPILVGVTSPVLEILVLSKTAKFSFRTMDYSPWSSKNLIDRNGLKKFMHVGIDVTCMYVNFDGCGIYGF